MAIEIEVIARRTEKVHVTMEWEMEVEVEDTRSGSIQIDGWVVTSAEELLNRCRATTAKSVTIDRIEGSK